ncbi:unnamed protein product, partial [Mesorhabditis spiculigera]
MSDEYEEVEVAEATEGDEEISAHPAEEDRTEDQQPEGEPVDEAAPAEDEPPAEEEPVAEEEQVEDIPVEEEPVAEEEPPAEEEPAPEEDAPVEEEPPAEEEPVAEEEPPAEEEPVPEEEPVAEEEPPAEEEPVAEEEPPAEEEPVAEEVPEEAPVEEEPVAEEEPPVEEEPVPEEEPVAEEEPPAEEEPVPEEEPVAEEAPAEEPVEEQVEQQEFTFDESAPPQEEVPASEPSSPVKSPKKKKKKAKVAEAEPEEAEPVAEEAPAEEPQAEEVVDASPQEEAAPEEEPQEEAAPEPEAKEPSPVPERRSSPPARRASPSPPPRREPQRITQTYDDYDKDSHRKIPPAREPVGESFSSWTPADSGKKYESISNYASDVSKKYDSGYSSSYTPTVQAYTRKFDDYVSTGPFSNALYSTSRLVSRSRSRTRERRNSRRAQRSSSNYYRSMFSSALPAPAAMHSREYSQPPPSAVIRTPGRSTSFASFIDYAGQKNYELQRTSSVVADSANALSRSSSRGNVDLYLGGGRLSRVDSFVNHMDTPYEAYQPASYERVQRSSSVSRPIGYSAYTSTPLYLESGRYDSTPVGVRSLYEGRIGALERSLSRERINKDRLRHQYQDLSSKLDQACRQMSLLRTSSYSAMPRSSVYTHMYPCY